jgi:gamma-glutamyltranspeptidase
VNGLGEDGFSISEIVAHSWANSEKLLKEISENGNDMLRNGKSLKAGQRWTYSRSISCYSTLHNGMETQ